MAYMKIKYFTTLINKKYNDGNKLPSFFYLRRDIMKKIVITDADFGLQDTPLDNPRTRFGARGIIQNDEGKIAVFNKQVKNEYKLPGGGIDEGEDPYVAFEREAIEETGCTLKGIQILGEIEERQGKENFLQKSFIFISKVKENLGTLLLTEKEKEEGAILHWLEPKEALAIMEGCIDDLHASSYDNVYRSKFMVKRDIEILKAFLKI